MNLRSKISATMQFAFAMHVFLFGSTGRQNIISTSNGYIVIFSRFTSEVEDIMKKDADMSDQTIRSIVEGSAFLYSNRHSTRELFYSDGRWLFQEALRAPWIARGAWIVRAGRLCVTPDFTSTDRRFFRRGQEVCRRISSTAGRLRWHGADDEVAGLGEFVRHRI
jgi:hypothetical protein